MGGVIAHVRRMARRQPVASAVLAVAMLLAFVGWSGVLADTNLPVPGPVRDRAAWQPSPIAKDWDEPAAPPLMTPVPGQAGAAGAPRAPGTPGTRGAATSAATARAEVTTVATATPARAPTRTATATGARTSTPTPRVGATATAGQATRTTGATGAAGAQGAGQAAGTWREGRLESKALGREMPYLVWLPPGYPRPARYPVIYLLHGGGDGVSAGRTEWRNVGAGDALGALIAANEVEPAIIVLPEGLQGYWINHANDGPRWADYVVNDLVEHIDRTFPTDARPERRAIGGLSMGGHGALHLALSHPNVFRIAGAHSPSIRPFKESPPFFGSESWYERFNPLTLAKSATELRRQAYWLDVGVQDPWRPVTEEVSKTLDQRGARVELRTYPGRHEGEYWKAHARDYMRFYALLLKDPGAPLR